MKTKVSDIGRDLSPGDLLAAYQGAEVEISNLRHILLWAAERLSSPDRRELSTMLNRHIIDGGIPVDPSEDQALDDREFLNTIDSIALSFDRMLTSQQLPHNAVHMRGLIRAAQKRIGILRKPSLAYHRPTR